MNRYFQIFVFLIALGLFGLGVIKTSYTGEAPQLAKVGVQMPVSFQLEVADTPEKQRKGLSGRASLPPFTGMVFPFRKAKIQCMWNKDVNFPLRVLFMADDGNIVNQATMPAGSEKPVCSTVPVKIVVEVGINS